MRFSVRVPVLSVKMTVVAPRVSTADRRLIQCMVARHSPHSPGQCHRRDDGKTFRDGSHRQCDSDLDHQEDRLYQPELRESDVTTTIARVTTDQPATET